MYSSPHNLFDIDTQWLWLTLPALEQLIDPPILILVEVILGDGCTSQLWSSKQSTLKSEKVASSVVGTRQIVVQCVLAPRRHDGAYRDLGRGDCGRGGGAGSGGVGQRGGPAGGRPAERGAGPAAGVAAGR